MKIVHVVGRKNHGKTALTTELIRSLVALGAGVGSIKHCGHDHELDIPGKDSFLHRMAGALPVAVVTPQLIATYQARAGGEDFYAQVAGLFADRDLVVVEGDLEGPGLKIEVWRAEMGSAPLALERGDIAALVTDDPVKASVPVWPRNDVPAVARRVLALLEKA